MRFTASDARAHKREMKTNLAPTGSGSGSMNRASLWGHRSLVWQFVVRNVEIRHKGSHLGLVWSVANPLLMLSLYVFVFGFVFG